MLNRIGIPAFVLLHAACVATGCTIDDRLVSLQGEIRGGDAGADELGERGSEGPGESEEPESGLTGNGGAGSEAAAPMGGGAGEAAAPGPLSGNGGEATGTEGASTLPLGGAGQGAGGSPLEPSPSAGDPPPPVFSGRAGAELCPAGPYPVPVSGVPQVRQLFALNENRHIDGPVWLDGALYFSAVGGFRGPSRLNRFVPGGTVETLIAETASHGLAVDMQGNLLAASHVPVGVSRFELPSGVRSQVSSIGTSPNDLVQRSDGNIYFTDLNRDDLGSSPSSTRTLRITPAGEVIELDPGLQQANGITLTPDGNNLYVTTRTRFVRYPLMADGTPLPAVTLFTNEPPQSPEGMAMDCAGNVYATESTRRLVRIFDPFGADLGRFGGPEVFAGDLSNLAFGGPDGTTLFITTFAGTEPGGVYAVDLNVRGLPY